jgi:hypothetical protein
MDIQEHLIAQLRAEQRAAAESTKESDEKARLNPNEESEGLRPCRSNSLYTRAGNEALTAIRHR